MTETDKENSIRFGIMCNSTHFPEWQAQSIEELLKIPGVECRLIINPKTDPKQKKKAGFFTNVKPSNYGWKVYYYWLRKKFKTIKRKDLSEVLSGVDQLEVETYKKGKFSEYFQENDLKKIKAYELDFILRYSFGIIRGEILDAAKYGVWSFHHGDEQKYRGGPAGFWEIYNGDNITGSILQRLTDRLDGGIVLKKGFFKTNLAYAKNRDQVFRESALWPASVCRSILIGETDVFKEEPSSTEAPIYKVPNNLRLFKYLIKNVTKRILKEITDIIFVDYWEVGVVNTPIHAFLNEEQPKVEWFKDSEPSKFRADPFGVIMNGEEHIWYEEYEYKKGLGFVNHTTPGNGSQKEHFSFKKNTHLSYPFILNIDNQVYMIPENADSGSVALYKMTSGKWEKFSVLLNDFHGVDPTIFRYDGKWWLFLTDKKNHPAMNLYIFHSESLFDGWREHPLNPVKTDIRSSRPAGSVFEVDGNLYRPAMDYSRTRQGNVTINKIEELSTTNYKEIVVRQVQPYRDSYFKDKIHTLSSLGEKTLVDGGRKMFFLRNQYFFRLGISKLKKRLKG